MLSAEEAESCSIHDIVMPLPGYDVIYPSHHGKNSHKVCPKFRTAVLNTQILSVFKLKSM